MQKKKSSILGDLTGAMNIASEALKGKKSEAGKTLKSAFNSAVVSGGSGVGAVFALPFDGGVSLALVGVSAFAAYRARNKLRTAVDLGKRLNRV